jgi:hypothetical protein
MAIDRTTWTALLDDDGSNLVGTLWTKDLVKTLLLDPIDARWAENTTTATGNQDNLAYAEADVLRCNNATALTLRGILAPAAPLKPGKPLLIVAIGAGTVTLNDQDANSTAANRLITGTAAPIALAAGTGWAMLRYDGATARWRVLANSAATGTGGGAVVQTTTSTGTVNNFALTAGATLLRCNNATALTLTGLAAGTDGQRLDLRSVGAGAVTLTDQDAGSTAANRAITGLSEAIVLAAGVGVIRLVYDATTARWVVLAYAPIFWVDVPYAGGNFTGGAGTWTVDSGDQATFKYAKIGRVAVVIITLNATSVAGTVNPGVITIPFAASGVTSGLGVLYDNSGSLIVPCVWLVSGTTIAIYKLDGSAWAAATNNTYVKLDVEFPW